MNGSICVWQVKTGDLLTCSKYQINGQPKVICTMFWHRLLQDTLFFADTEVSYNLFLGFEFCFVFFSLG